MSSDGTIAAWCPACGKELQRRYARCTNPGSGTERMATPVFVEINALTQYLVGVPTFVEFRILNCSDEPLSLDSLEVKLANRVLEPGLYAETPAQEIAPGEKQPLLLDRKVDFGIDTVMPGEYSLDIELAYTHQEKQSRLKARHPVRFSQPLDRRIYVYDYTTKTFHKYEGGHLPEVETAYSVRIGEQTVQDQRVMHLCRMKQDSGLRFVPLLARLAADDAKPEAPWTETETVACEKCGALLKEGGAFCHACGHRLQRTLSPSLSNKTETQGYCPHCTFPRGRLKGRYRYCPVCGNAIDMHMSIAPLPSYMVGVQTRTNVRIRATAREPLRVNRIRAFIGEKNAPLECGFLEDVNYGMELEPDESADVTCLVYCPPGDKTGDRKLTLELEYACGERLCKLSGATHIRVIPGAEKLGTIIHQYGAQTVEMAGDAVMSQGTWSINQADSIPEDKREAFMKKLAELAEVPEKPLPLHTVTISTSGPAITWEPSHRAAVWFIHEDVQHRYCISTMYHPESGQFEPVSFGRKLNANTFRLYEVEDILDRKGKGEKSGSISWSRISSIQWVVRPASETAGVGLEFTHRSTSNTSFVGKAKKLSLGETALLGLHESIECKRKGAGQPIIGLRYGAHALPFRVYEAARNRARAALDSMTYPPERLPEWPGRLGGYRLNRLHSLTGELFPQKRDVQMLEAYLLIPAWITIGSAPSACVVIPAENVAPIHAYLLHVDGYFFI
ncbi:MAG: hypothetical protein R6V12_13515, partial [Candidatus Hydrogenedentota bacterium]